MSSSKENRRTSSSSSACSRPCLCCPTACRAAGAVDTSVQKDFLPSAATRKTGDDTLMRLIAPNEFGPAKGTDPETGIAKDRQSSASKFLEGAVDKTESAISSELERLRKEVDDRTQKPGDFGVPLLGPSARAVGAEDVGLPTEPTPLTEDVTVPTPRPKPALPVSPASSTTTAEELPTSSLPVSPLPLTLQQGPAPTTPEEHRSGFDAWMEAFKRPEVIAGLLQFGINVGQPRAPGQNTFGHILGATTEGLIATGRASELGRKNVLEEREQTRKEAATTAGEELVDARVIRFKDQTTNDLAKMRDSKEKNELTKQALNIRQQIADGTIAKGEADIINAMWQRAIGESTTESLTGDKQVDSGRANRLFGQKIVQAGYRTLLDVVDEATVRKALGDPNTRAQMIRVYGRTAVEAAEITLGIK